MLHLVLLYLLASAILLAALPGMTASLPWPEPILWAAARRGRHPVQYWASRIKYDDLVRYATVSTGRATRKIKPVKNVLRVPVAVPLYRESKENIMGKEVTVRTLTGYAVVKRFYTIRNSVLPELCADFCAAYKYPIVVIQWPDWINPRHMKTKMTIVEDGWASPCRYDASWFAGSSSKKWKTYGLPEGEEFWFKSAFFTGAEKSVKMARAVVPSGVVTVRRPLNVMIVKDNTVVANRLIHDSYCLAVDDLYGDELYDVEPIMFGDSRQNAQIWQNLRWADISTDALKAQDDAWRGIVTSNMFNVTYKAISLRGGDLKKRLINAWGMFRYHPIIARELSDLIRRWLVEMSTTVPLMMMGYLAIPSSCGHYVFPSEMDGEDLGIVRWPLATFTNLTVQEWSDKIKGLIERERALIAELTAVVQFTITVAGRKNGSAKGLMGLLPRRLMPRGVDIVMSESSWKLGWIHSNEMPGCKRADGSTVPARHVFSVDDCVVVALGVYDKRCVAATPPMSLFEANDGSLFYGRIKDIPKGAYKRLLVTGWLDMAGDWDGDQVMAMILTMYRLIINAIRRFPVVVSGKSAKKKDIPVEDVGEFLINAMKSALALGWATNSRGKYLCLPEHFQNMAAFRMNLEKLIPTSNRYNAFRFFADKNQGTVDAFKSMEGIANTEWNINELARCSKAVNFAITGREGVKVNVPWLGTWMGDKDLYPGAEYAFRTILPTFVDRLDEGFLEMCRDNPGDAKLQAKLSVHIDPIFRECTIGQLYNNAYSYLEIIWDKIDCGIWPLSNFYHIAHCAAWDLDPSLRKGDVEVADLYLSSEWKSFHEKHISPIYDDGDEDIGHDVVSGTVEWETEWGIRCQEWANASFGGDTERAAAALFCAAHQHKTTRASGSSAIVGFLDQVCKWGEEQRNWSGTTLVRGIRFHFQEPPEKFSTKCQVVLENDNVYIKVSAPVDEGQIWEDGQTPPGTIGIVPEIEQGHIRDGVEIPPIGNYVGTFRKDGKIYWVDLRSENTSSTPHGGD